ncbi:hypothetical protein [Nitrososphaera sp.]|uniref:hypothetical protein n=1 Tax=Nitrososphaera sp. TaxID=1971748 RepID=UPI001841F01C|nr:hypothetical protein [Nitrososphaera sp.]NWG37474.1 hypothetical protein [Nitrososphaera sp.]
MVRITVSPDAARYLIRKMKRPNVIVYRDIFRAKRGSVFILRVRAADGREPGGQFEASDHAGVTVWVESEFLRRLAPGEGISIGLDRGLIKSLKVEMASERISALA